MGVKLVTRNVSIFIGQAH